MGSFNKVMMGTLRLLSKMIMKTIYAWGRCLISRLRETAG